MYKLKNNEENFTVTDGAFAGRSYTRGRLYAKIPPHEARRFDDLAAPQVINEQTASAVDDAFQPGIPAEVKNKLTETARKPARKKAMFSVNKED